MTTDQPFSQKIPAQIDNQKRRIVPWLDRAITTQVETGTYMSQIWEAIACHRSQLPGYDALIQMPEEQRHALFAQQSFYRTLSLVNIGREIEKDLFVDLLIIWRCVSYTQRK